MRYRLTETKLSKKAAFMVVGTGMTDAGILMEKDYEKSTTKSRAVNRFVQTITDDIRDAIDAGREVIIETDIE